MSALKRVSIWIAMAIPPLGFYALLARSLTALPIVDDYPAILGFLLQWKKQSGIRRIVTVLTYQHNDYRCMFENALSGFQYAILGHTNLKALSILGDLLVLPLFAVLYLLWRECGRPRDYTLLAFVPVSWMLFQLQYEGTLNFATPGLQIIPVTLFVLFTCFLAARAGNAAFLGALAGLLLCIASNGDGLFMIPIGALLYLQRREFKRLAAWCCVSALAALVYFHGYDFSVEAIHTHASNNILSIVQHLSLVYALAFLGDIAAVRNPLPAVLFGAVLVGVFIFATVDRLFARRPALYYSALFFVVTSAAVSGLRSSLGLVTALNSAYRINSTVLSILLYLYLADRFYGIRVRPLLLRASACAFGVLLLGFNLASDRGGEKVLLEKRHAVEAAMLRWERHEPGPAIPASSSDDMLATAKERGDYEPVGPILSDAIREGIYQPPAVPMGN